MSKASNGAIVFAYLQSEHPIPRAAWEIARQTGLSYSQVHSGLNHIREVLGPIHSEPLIYDPRYLRRVVAGKRQLIQHSYLLSDSAVAIKEYGAYRLRIHVKQLRNLGLVLTAGAEKTGDRSIDILVHSIGQAADTAEFVQKQLLGVKSP